jgi:hypothetical protein
LRDFHLPGKGTPLEEYAGAFRRNVEAAVERLRAKAADRCSA